MEYHSLDQIKAEFNLRTHDLDEMRRSLKKMQVKLYPRGQSGQIQTPEEKTRFSRIDAAITFIDELKYKQGQLIPLSEVPKLMEVWKDLVPSTRNRDLQVRLSEQIRRSIGRIRSRHLLPKVSVSTLSAILTIIWVFPRQISEHPVLGDLIDITSPAFSILWLFCLAGTAAMWVLFRRRAGREKRFKTSLELESVQNRLLSQFIFRRQTSAIEQRPFTKDEFIHYLVDSPPEQAGAATILPDPEQIDLELAQSLADVIFTRAEAKGVIVKETGALLSDVFVLNPASDLTTDR
jgi:hypothetical protein